MQRVNDKDDLNNQAPTQLSMNIQLVIKTNIQKSEEVSCFKSLRCIYLANKC